MGECRSVFETLDLFQAKREEFAPLLISQLAKIKMHTTLLSRHCLFFGQWNVFNVSRIIGDSQGRNLTLLQSVKMK